jgi:allene oxide cyclase
MPQMKKSLIPTGVISLVVLGLVVTMFVINTGVFAAHANSNTDINIHVVEHAITDTVGDADNGKPSPDALGNVLAFHNPVFDSTDTKQVGVDNGQCTRTIARTNGVWECFWTVILSAGQITVEGPYHDNGTDTMLAITGGTGAYSEARGQMRLHVHSNSPLEYDFFYEVKM